MEVVRLTGRHELTGLSNSDQSKVTSFDVPVLYPAYVVEDMWFSCDIYKGTKEYRDHLGYGYGVRCFVCFNNSLKNIIAAIPLSGPGTLNSYQHGTYQGKADLFFPYQPLPTELPIDVRCDYVGQSATGTYLYYDLYLFVSPADITEAEALRLSLGSPLNT